MADKQYNVNLEVKVGDSISNVSELLEKLVALKNEANNLSNGEVALNVVVRNQGFDTVMSNMAKRIEAADKAAKGVGDAMAKGWKGASDELDKDAKRMGQVIDQLATKIKSAFKGIEDSIATAVQKGARQGFTGFRSEVGKQTTLVKSNIGSSVDDLTKAKTLLEQLREKNSQLGSDLKAGAQQIRDAAQEFTKQYMSGQLEFAKHIADKHIDRDFISKRDQGYLDAYGRKIDRTQDRKDMQAERREAREDRRQQVEAERQLRLLASEKKRLEAETVRIKEQAKLTAATTVNTEIKNARAQLALQEAQEAYNQKKMQIATQLKQIDDARIEAQSREMREQTALEKQLVKLKEAEKRVEDQIISTQQGKKVSLSAIYKATQNVRKEEYETHKLTLKTLANYDKIKDSTEKIAKRLQTAGTALQRLSSATSSVTSMFSSMRSLASTMSNAVLRVGQTGLRYATQAARSIASTAYEQYSKLEVANIGFENFFGKEGAAALIPRIKQEAINAPGLNTGDLADYVRQLAPISKGNADVALNAALGMLKTIQYGGAEGSTEMEYVIKNIRDVMAKGQATAIDLRQFNRAMPIMEEVLKSIGRSDFIKDGKLNITKENAKQILQAFADINTTPGSPVADIYQKMGNTIEGLKEAIKEQFTTGLNDTLVDLGFYDKVREIMRNIKEGGLLEKFFTWLGNTANAVLDFLSSLDWEAIGSALATGFKEIGAGFRDAYNAIKTALGATNLAGVIVKISGMIANFIRGAGEGISKVLNIISWAEKNISSDILNKIGFAAGLLTSFFGRIIEFAGRMLADILGFSSRMSFIGASSARAIGGARTNSINRVITNAASFNKYQSMVQGAHLAGLTPMLGDPTTRIYGSYKRQTPVAYNAGMDTISYYNKKAGEWTSMGGAANAYKYNRKEYWNALGGGSTAKGVIRDISDKFKETAGKAIKALAIYSVGSAVSSIAGEIAQSVTGSSDAKGITTTLGNALSAGLAVGSQFGLIAGAGASLVSTFGALIQEQQKLAEATRKLRETEMEAATLSYANDLGFNVFEQIKNMRDAQGNPLWQAYDDASQSGYDALMDKARELAGRTDVELSDAMTQIKNAYLEAYAKNKGIAQLNEWGKELEVSGATAINYANRQADLKKIYENMVRMGWIEKANLFDEDENGNAINVSGQEYANYIKKATGGKMSIDTEEAATAIAQKTTELVKEFDANMGLDINIKYRDDEGNELTHDEWLEYHNLIATGNGGYIKKAYIEAYVEIHGKDKELLRKLLEANLEDAKVKAQVNKKGVSTGKQFNQNQAFGNWQTQFSPFNHNGGLIRPIYRADGGETPARGVDTVPIMSQPGEFIMRKAAASRLGLGVLNALNFGDVGKAARLLGSKFSQSWNNSRTYSRNINANRNTINNYNNFNITNRSHGGYATSMNIANRLAMGF